VLNAIHVPDLMNHDAARVLQKDLRPVFNMKVPKGWVVTFEREDTSPCRQVCKAKDKVPRWSRIDIVHCNCQHAVCIFGYKLNRAIENLTCVELDLLSMLIYPALNLVLLHEIPSLILHQNHFHPGVEG
jgi:hypothetical protein